MCIPCQKKKAFSNQLVTKSSYSISNVNFERMVYVGESGVVIPTTLSNVVYQNYNYGNEMWVAAQDILAFPNLWKTLDEFNNINS